MLKLNRKVEYSLVALKHIHSKPKGQLSTVREICTRYGTPFDPLAHVLRILNAEGILQSEQGAHGGYRIVKDLEETSFADLVEMIEGPLGFTDCIKSQDCGCNMLDRCNILSPMFAINQKMLEFLHSVSLADLISPDSFWLQDAEASLAAQLAKIV